jgi:hypothetical protein
MKYLVLHAVDESLLEEPPSPAIEDELRAWVTEMTARGIELDGARLHPSTDATTVRKRGGAVQVVDGPFAETKEVIAGYDVVECPDLDTAVAVASAHPTLHVGAIEVRAFDDGMPVPEVPETTADGRRRYLMLVCADLRSTTSETADAPSDAGEQPCEEEEEPEVDAWVESVSDRRIYGWPLTGPETAVTLRRVDGRVVTTDGPFAETKEQIAGYDLLECADLDDALAAARTHPVASVGALEVRPLLG